jgi:hypothetical protein
MKHTDEYYEHQIAMLEKQLNEWRNIAKYYLATNGMNANMEMLRADRDRWKVMAEARASKLLTGYKAANCE